MLGSTHGRTRIIREAYYEHPLYVPLVRRAYENWATLEQEAGERLLHFTGGLMIGPPSGELVTGAERLSVRDVALAMGARLGQEPRFVNAEAGDALLSDTLRMTADFGPPELPAATLIEWVTQWVAAERPLLNKPTRFERRDGRF